MDKKKLKDWAEIAKLLSDKATYQDLALGISSKEAYLDSHLPELRDGTPRYILDIGAGTGMFCYVCLKLGHKTLANLPNNGVNKSSYAGYRKACDLFGVPVLSFTYGSEPSELEDGTFDIVNTQGMIGDLRSEAWHATLDEMLRVVKPGGTLLVCPGYVSGVKNTSLVNEWAKQSKVKLTKFWEDKVTWKWQKLA